MNVRPLYPLITSVLVATSSSATMAAPPNGEEKIFVGYAYGLPKDINYSLYTHLCHAFITADEQGNLKPNKHVPNAELVRSAHKARVKVLLSLGGWGWDRQFAAIVADPAAEDRYVTAVMKLLDDSGYDGIDLDWEYPDTAEEVPGFERLAVRFRKSLDALGRRKNRSMLLTMAASADPNTLKRLPTEFLLSTFDWINVMTYDYTGEWTSFAGHHSPLFASSKAPAESRESTELTMKHLVDKRRIPANRLAVGLPLYGRGFAAAAPYAPINGRRPPRGVGGNYARLEQLLSQERWRREWDDETKNPWLISPDSTAVIGYDDAESLALRTDWAMQQGFRGLFFWEVAQDRMPDGSNPLQQAARDHWQRAKAKK